MAKTAVVTFGRANPFTVGHRKLVQAVNKEARKHKGDAFVFLSHSQDPAKNPLTYQQKIKWAKKSTRYPESIIKSDAKNFFEVMTQVYNKGYDELIVVVGADRIAEFENLARKYNGVEARHGFYDFNNISVVSAGDRDPDAEGVEGMSASKVRAAVAAGDFESFKMGVSDVLSDRELAQYYQDVRRGMGIRESFILRFKSFIGS